MRLRPGKIVRVKDSDLPGFKGIRGKPAIVISLFGEQQEYCRVKVSGVRNIIPLRCDSLEKV
jgi:hypothetical protein